MSGIVIGRHNSNYEASTEKKQKIDLIRALSNISNISAPITTKLHLEKGVKNGDTTRVKPEPAINQNHLKPINLDTSSDIKNEKDITTDFKNFIKEISLSEGKGRLAENLPSGYDGINNLEKKTAKKISMILSDENKKKLDLMSESGKSQTYFPEAWGDFLMCLSTHSDEELVNYKDSINKLTAKLYTLFDKKNKFSTSYYDKHEEFNKKLNQHLKMYFKRSNKSIHSIVMENFKKNVFSDEYKKHIAYLYNKNNDIHDVFRPSINGYLKSHQVYIDEYGSVTLSSDLTVLLRRSFAFRDILKNNDDNKTNSDDENVKGKDKDDKKKVPDNSPPLINGQFGNSNGIFVNGNGNSVFNSPINIHNIYTFPSFSFEKSASEFTNATTRSTFSASSPIQRERIVKAITLNSDKIALQSVFTEHKNSVISPEPVAPGLKPAAFEEPVTQGMKSPISEEPVPLSWKPAIPEEPVPLGWKSTLSNEPIPLRWKNAISDEPIPRSWIHTATSELPLKMPEQIVSVNKSSSPARRQVAQPRHIIRKRPANISQAEVTEKRAIIDVANMSQAEKENYVHSLPEQYRETLVRILLAAGDLNETTDLMKYIPEYFVTPEFNQAVNVKPNQAIYVKPIKKSVTLSEYADEAQTIAARLQTNRAS
ncbi:hypothetical protein [Pantoea eucrina]|uniref:hypothetical protein n=1 Tax=Pantoea eucrina TaxID=472693 RepID=UPI003CF7A3E0